MKEWMKEALVFTVLSMFVTVVVFQFGDLPVGGVDSEYKSRLRCALHGIPPQVQLSKVPLTLGTDWVTFDLPQNMPRAPQKEYVVLTFPHEMFTEPEPHAEGTKHQKNGGSQDSTETVEVEIEVAVLDPQGRMVYLQESMRTSESGAAKSKQLQINYGLSQRGWDKTYFGPDVKLAKVAVRSSSPVPLQSVVWSPLWYCMAPPKTWSDVQPESLYKFEDGQRPNSAE